MQGKRQIRAVLDHVVEAVRPLQGRRQELLAVPEFEPRLAQIAHAADRFSLPARISNQSAFASSTNTNAGHAVGHHDRANPPPAHCRLQAGPISARRCPDDERRLQPGHPLTERLFVCAILERASSPACHILKFDVSLSSRRSIVRAEMAYLKGSIYAIVASVVMTLIAQPRAETYRLDRREDPKVFDRVVNGGQYCFQSNGKIRVKMFRNQQRVLYDYWDKDDGEGCLDLKRGWVKIYIRAEEDNITVVGSENLETFDEEVCRLLDC